jgi:PAS domain S-box-containing protein
MLAARVMSELQLRRSMKRKAVLVEKLEAEAAASARAMSAFERSEAQHSTIFNQALVGMALGVPGKGLVLANKRLGQILGRAPADLIGLEVADLTHPDDLSWNLPLYECSVRSGEPMLIEKRYLRPDGTAVWCRTSVSFVSDGDGGKLAVVVVDDLSEQKKAEAAVEALQERALRASRLSAMGAMASTLAHELNQPLAAASNYLAAGKALLDRTPLDKLNVKIVLAKAGEQTHRAAEIIRRMRDFTIGGKIDRKPEDLYHLICRARETLVSRIVECGASIRLVLGPGEVAVHVDATQMEQVLGNVLRNAVEAVQKQPVRLVEISATQRSEAVEIRIADSGPGLSVDRAEELFQPFLTSKEGGLGLGLAISRTIVEAHGGTLRAEKSSLGGAALLVILPAVT